jgi:aminopeptidase N
MLKQHLGAERFWATINHYLTRHAFGNALSDDLRRSVLDATGENLSWFWSQWAYQAGHPQLVVSATYDSVEASLALTLRQVQVDTLQPDSTGLRYSTPPVFRAPISIRVGTARGDVRSRVLLEQREQVVRIESLRSAPTMVVIDEDNSLLKTLIFEQPTGWLATQLARDPNVWNRAWVIEQLSRRTADSVAAVALARAARSADYYRVRAEAALALREFPAGVAEPALQAAARDTSSSVREAAVLALGAIGGEKAESLALAAWTRDSSDAVRATALRVLARLDSAGSRELIRRGLRTPSYRDVIQIAAITAARNIPDSATVEELGRIVGEQRLAVLTLASLARRGDTQALGILVRHRDDKRPWVRRWVLEAIEQELERGTEKSQRTEREE